MPNSNTVFIIAISALLIGAAVRALKSDSLPSWLNIPPRVRPWLAIGLGQVLTAVEAVGAGTPWKDAVLHGLAASLAAMLGHDTLVEGARGGRELGAGPKATDDSK
jgi:hypothetical protein